MKFIYVALCALLLIRIVIRKRFDFLSIAALSFIGYTSSCLVGRVWISRAGGYYYNEALGTQTYLIIFAQMVLILIALCFRLENGILNEDDFGVRDRPVGYRLQRRKNSKFWNWLLIACAAIFLYNIVFRIGLSVFFSAMRKSKIMEQVDSLFSFGIWGAIICFLYGMLQRKPIHIMGGGMMIMMMFIMGSRAYVATAAAGAMVVVFTRHRTSLRNKIRIGLIGLVLVLALLLYKSVYRDVRALDFRAVAATLVNPDTYLDMLDIDEFRINASLYNYVLEKDFRFPVMDSAARVLSIIPVVNDFIPTKYPIRFSSYLMNTAFQSTYGLAGNFWAESYAMGGYAFILFMTGVWLYLVKRSGEYVRRNRESAAFPVTIASYCCFYLHRLDWVQALGCVKSVLIIGVLFLCYRKVTV